MKMWVWRFARVSGLVFLSVLFSVSMRAAEPPPAANPETPSVPGGAYEPGPEPADAATEDLERRREIEGLRRELAYVNKSFEASAYQLYRSNTSSRQEGSSTAVLGAIQSFGGVELAYRPPVIGFVDGRVLQVFTRFLWANEPGGLTIDNDSWEAGLGVRYKPFASQNFFVGVEKLFAIGDSADNNTLLRAQYGWTDGSDIEIGEKFYNYSFAYADFGYFAQHTTNTVFYAEGRQGITFNIGDRVTISPHAILDGRVQSQNRGDFSYVEGGAGVAVRVPFNDTEYESYRSSFEALVQYRADIYNAENGVVVTGILRF
jgi:hypothetical protein